MAKRILSKKIICVSLGEGIDPLMAGMVLPHLARMFPNFIIQFNLHEKFISEDEVGKNTISIRVYDPNKKGVKVIFMNVDSVLLDEAFDDELDTPKYMH